ncbi:MAG: sirohydrochlorin chelatase [Mycobacterium sp.]
MRAARLVTGAAAGPDTLVLTAHGSADPRSAAVTRAVADQIRAMRPDLDVRVAFCEQNDPNLRQVLADVRSGVVSPLLLADAYHARVDIPALIAESGADVLRAGVLGEDDRLIHVLREQIECLGVSRLDGALGVLVTAVGSSRPDANARTARVADAVREGTRWHATAAFATGPRPTLQEAADQLRRAGSTHLVIAPWFLAPGRITDRVAEFAHSAAIPMAQPLGAHPLVAATVLDRFDQARAARAAA